MLQHKINFEKIDWETPLEGVKSKIYKYGNKQLRLVEYTQEMPPHWCEKGHYGLIFRKGDGVFIPDGTEHKHRARVL